MKPTHLITISKRLDELYALVSSGDITSIQFRELVMEYNIFSNESVKLEHFIVAEKGVPLPEVKEPIICNSEEAVSKLIYNKAKKKVIFEGWQLTSDGTSIYTGTRVIRIDQNTTKTNAIEFYFEDNKLTSIDGICEDVPFIFEDIKSMEMLAFCTKDNPLKFKIK